MCLRSGLVLGLPSGVQTASAGQQPEEVKANAVLAGRTVLGGEDKLAGVEKDSRSTGRVAGPIGNFNLEGDTGHLPRAADKFRRNEALTLGGPIRDRSHRNHQRQRVLDGDERRLWRPWARSLCGGGFPGAAGGGQQGDGRGAPPSSEAQERLRDFQRRNLQSEVSRLLIALLLTSDQPLRWVGTAQSPEGNAT